MHPRTDPTKIYPVRLGNGKDGFSTSCLVEGKRKKQSNYTAATVTKLTDHVDPATLPVKSARQKITGRQVGD